MLRIYTKIDANLAVWDTSPGTTHIDGIALVKELLPTTHKIPILGLYTNENATMEPVPVSTHPHPPKTA